MNGIAETLTGHAKDAGQMGITKADAQVTHAASVEPRESTATYASVKGTPPRIPHLTPLQIFRKWRMEKREKEKMSLLKKLKK